MTGGDPLRAFAAALHAAGLHPRHVLADGAVHRCHAEGDKGGKNSGWYVLHVDGNPAGAFGDWRSGLSERWQHDHAQLLDATALARLQADIRRAQQQREIERAKTRKAAQAVAHRRWLDATTAKPSHPYLQAKGVQAHGIRQLREALLIPMRDGSGTLWAVQSITPTGEKRFGRGARKRGLYHAIGPQVHRVLCIAEGYATAASILEATGYPVAVAFDAGNLLPVAQTLRGKFPQARMLICADNDTATAERIGTNPGIEAATKAAQAVNGVLVSPFDFPATGQEMTHECNRDNGNAA